MLEDLWELTSHNILSGLCHKQNLISDTTGYFGWLYCVLKIEIQLFLPSSTIEFVLIFILNTKVHPIVSVPDFIILWAAMIKWCWKLIETNVENYFRFRHWPAAPHSSRLPILCPLEEQTQQHQEQLPRQSSLPPQEDAGWDYDDYFWSRAILVLIWD